MPTPRLPQDAGEAEILEFLLNCGGTENAADEAKRLLADCGGLYEAVKAVSIGKYGERTREAAHLALRVGRRFAEERMRPGGAAAPRPRIVRGRRLPGSEHIGTALMNMYDSETVEQLMVVTCDRNDRVLDKFFVSTGDEKAVRANIKGIVEAVLRDEVKGVVLAHNHPSSAALPSAADLTATKMLGWLLLCLGKELIDHIVVYEDDYVSMYESGLLESPTSTELWREFCVRDGRLVSRRGKGEI